MLSITQNHLPKFLTFQEVMLEYSNYLTLDITGKVLTGVQPDGNFE